MEIVNLSEFEPGWNWLKNAFGAARSDLDWKSASVHDIDVPAWLPRRRTVQRVAAAWKARTIVSGKASVLVSHGPRMTAFGALATRVLNPFGHHVAYSFNFTHLPTGLERALMRLAFQQVDRFVVFSNMERSLYAQYFGVDIRKIDMIHWAVRPPQFDPTRPPLVAGSYVCALGSQGRDYRTLLAAATRLPDTRFVIVGTPESLAGLSVPDNVEIRTNVPAVDAYNVLAHSALMVVPLAGAKVPCGHVTLVSAMHLGIPIVATDSAGIADYVVDDETGRLVPAADPINMARAIEALVSSPDERRRLGRNGKAFASAHCEESSVVRYFAGVLDAYGR